MYQKIIIVGNLGRDPELRYTASGDAVTNLSLATNRSWTSGDGEKVDETTWFRVSVWGRSAEACNQHLAKGRQVLVEGILQPDPDTGGPRIWEDGEGNSRASFEIRASTVKFLGGAGNASPATATSAVTGDIPSDEIPF